jgi:hypothetical protein
MRHQSIRDVKVKSHVIWEHVNVNRLFARRGNQPFNFIFCAGMSIICACLIMLSLVFVETELNDRT